MPTRAHYVPLTVLRIYLPGSWFVLPPLVTLIHTRSTRCLHVTGYALPLYLRLLRLFYPVVAPPTFAVPQLHVPLPGCTFRYTTWFLPLHLCRIFSTLPGFWLRTFAGCGLRILRAAAAHYTGLVCGLRLLPARLHTVALRLPRFARVALLGLVYARLPHVAHAFLPHGCVLQLLHSWLPVLVPVGLRYVLRLIVGLQLCRILRLRCRLITFTTFLPVTVLPVITALQFFWLFSSVTCSCSWIDSGCMPAGWFTCRLRFAVLLPDAVLGSTTFTMVCNATCIRGSPRTAAAYRLFILRGWVRTFSHPAVVRTIPYLDSAVRTGSVRFRAPVWFTTAYAACTARLLPHCARARIWFAFTTRGSAARLRLRAAKRALYGL